MVTDAVTMQLPLVGMRIRFVFCLAKSVRKLFPFVFGSTLTVNLWLFTNLIEAAYYANAKYNSIIDAMFVSKESRDFSIQCNFSS